MRVLVLGAYGLIGLAIARALHAAGHTVTGLGRSPDIGPRLFPSIRWIEADLGRLRVLNHAATAGALAAVGRLHRGVFHLECNDAQHDHD